MLINFKNKGMPAYAFAVYNFSQVSDAVLLVMADKRKEKPTILFTYCDNYWQTNDNLSFLDDENLQRISKQLTRLIESRTMNTLIT